MKRILLTAAAIVLVAGCSIFRHKNQSNPYEEAPFYTQWTRSGSALDNRINATIDALRENPNAAPLHNELGQLLVQKGFPKDAEREFERAVNSDSHFYQAWYNLGVVRAARDDYSGAERAFRRTARLMKGHAEALFQLGLIEEKRGNRNAAIDYYAKALRHNPSIMDVRVNPRILDTKLITLALLRNYELEHGRQSSRLLGTPAGYVSPAPKQQEAPSPQPTAPQIVTPAPPVTETGTQTVPPKTST